MNDLEISAVASFCKLLRKEGINRKAHDAFLDALEQSDVKLPGFKDQGETARVNFSKLIAAAERKHEGAMCLVLRWHRKLVVMQLIN